ncbi:MAG: hypothetical protein KGD63_00215 [Candidatus Lokiarchaeota archaeon]|nr:hypothetical protein [Candidatus Lokiarchaeota archaeon]
MVKKKKIREDFDDIFRSGDEEKIKTMLKEHPWLLEEVSNEMSEVMENEQQIISALGIMEDELGESVPLNDILYSLKNDFDIRKSENELKEILENLIPLDLVKKSENKWSLTNEGGRICDDYLNRFVKLHE